MFQIQIESFVAVILGNGLSERLGIGKPLGTKVIVMFSKIPAFFHRVCFWESRGKPEYLNLFTMRVKELSRLLRFVPRGFIKKDDELPECSLHFFEIFDEVYGVTFWISAKQLFSIIG